MFSMSDYTQLPIPDIERWSTEQVLVVYDLCQIISVTLVYRFDDQSFEKMIESNERQRAYIQRE